MFFSFVRRVTRVNGKDFAKKSRGILAEIKGWVVVIWIGHIGLPHIQLLFKAFIGLLDIVLEHFQLVNPPVR